MGDQKVTWKKLEWQEICSSQFVVCFFFKWETQAKKDHFNKKNKTSETPGSCNTRCYGWLVPLFGPRVIRDGFNLHKITSHVILPYLFIYTTFVYWLTLLRSFIYQGIYKCIDGIVESLNHMLCQENKKELQLPLVFLCLHDSNSRQESERFAKRVGGSPNLGWFSPGEKNPGGFWYGFVGYLGMNGR